MKKTTIGYIDGQGNHREMPIETFKREYCTVLGLQDDFKQSDIKACLAIKDNPDIESPKGQLLMAYAANRDTCFIIDILQQDAKNEKITLSLIDSFNKNNSLIGDAHRIYEVLKHHTMHELAFLMQDCKKKAFAAIEQVVL